MTVKPTSTWPANPYKKIYYDKWGLTSLGMAWTWILFQSLKERWSGRPYDGREKTQNVYHRLRRLRLQTSIFEQWIPWPELWTFDHTFSWEDLFLLLNQNPKTTKAGPAGGSMCSVCMLICFPLENLLNSYNCKNKFQEKENECSHVKRNVNEIEIQTLETRKPKRKFEK